MEREGVLQLFSQRLIRVSVTGFSARNVLNVDNLAVIRRLSPEVLKEGAGIHNETIN